MDDEEARWEAELEHRETLERIASALERIADALEKKETEGTTEEQADE